jgi:hypothetical protein
MLKQRPNNHLSADQLLQALVDPPDPGTERQTHLAQCPACQKDLESLKQGFGRLGRTAAKMAPAPARPFRIPSKAAPAAWWRFKPMWATVAIGALLFAFTVWWPHALAPPAPVPNVAVQNPEPGLPLFDQVDALADDALPSTMNALAAASDMDDMDEDMDWLIPLAGDDQNDDSWI